MILLAFVKYSEYLLILRSKFLIFGQIIWTVLNLKKSEKYQEFSPAVIIARDDFLKQSLTIGFWFRLGLIFFLALPTFF